MRILRRLGSSRGIRACQQPQTRRRLGRILLPVASVSIALPALAVAGVLGTVGAATSAAAQPVYSFRTLNNNADPTFNQLLGINDAGVIAGYYGNGMSAQHPNKGYTLVPPYTQANYTNENFPGSSQTQVTGINDLGDTVGFWVDNNMNNFGFSYIKGVFTQYSNTTIAACASATIKFDQLLGINDHGVAAGFCTDGTGNNHAYELDTQNGQFANIVLPPSFAATTAMATGINDQGTIAGTYTSAATAQTAGWLDTDGTFTAISVPGSTSTSVLGINNSGELVGSYTDGSGNVHGFIDTNGIFQTIDDPHASQTPAQGVQGTVVNGLNNNGQIVGFYADAQGNVDGFLGDSNTPLVAANPYHAVTPDRLCDTRPGTGTPCSGHTLGTGGTVNVQVTGVDGVPTDATAVVVNVTATDVSTGSFFTVYPTKQPLPTASNINVSPDQTIPNLVEVGLGSGGDITVYNANGTADAVVDLEGYVSPPTGPSDTSGRFNPLPPSRICDTRLGTSPNQCNGEGTRAEPIGPGGTLNVSVDGQGGVPSTGVSAVALNVTVADPSADSFLTVYPAGQTRPNASNLNYTTGLTIPNRVIVPVGANGQISLYNAVGSTNVIVDVNGWFTDSSTSSGDLFTPATAPIRILDTRLTGQKLGPQGVLGLGVAANYGVPSNAAALVANATVTNTTGLSFLTMFPNFASLPLASDLNWNVGQTIANLTITQLGFGGGLQAYNQAGSTDLILDVAGWYTPASPA